MATIIGDDLQLRNAVRWISDQLREHSPRPATALVQDATLRFDLNPKQAEYLLHFYRRKDRAR